VAKRNPDRDTLPRLPPGTPGRPEKPRYREQYGVVIICPDEPTQRVLFEGLRALKPCGLKVVVT
jgi:hypothetical protein